MMKKTAPFLILAIVIHGMFASTVFAQMPRISSLPDDSFTVADGHLRFVPWYNAYMKMGLNEVRSDTLFVFNDWGSSMQLEFRNLPSFLSVKPSTALLAPKEKGYLVITYDASKRADIDLVTDRIEFMTNDTLFPVKSLDFIVVIAEDFSDLTRKQLRKAPVAYLDKDFHDFGEVKQGTLVQYDVLIGNKGKSPLHIQKIRGTCGCTVGNPEKWILQPGERSMIPLTFNTFGRSGHHTKTVTIITNDPVNTCLIFNLKGIITE